MMPPAILSRFDLLYVMLDEPDDVEDERKARHIVAVHQRRDRAMHAPYTPVQLQRYIRWARSLRPTITRDAHAELVRAYVRLRQGDSQPGSSSCYRITVRQLEALVRLSEALARMRGEESVTRWHVREAKRLISTIIIAVTARDVMLENMDDDEFDEYDPAAAAEPEPPAEDMEAEAAAAGGAEAPADAPPPDGAAEAGGAGEGGRAAPQTVEFEKFARVKEALALRLKQVADSADEAAAGDVALAGLSQAELLRWYLNEQSEKGAFADTAALAAEYRLVKTIIAHLIRRDGTIIIVSEPSEEELEALPEAEQRRARTDRRILTVHPDWSL